ncbi:peptide deformylase [Streptomyces sp. NPDC090077]|uniref:peptide deformylase n=1 Tax=Streptomyces sp. NPDC090077 TaxID=3365938 RepID=UPI003817E390
MPTPSTLMTQAGIVQEGDPLLASTAQPFELPADAEEARTVVQQLMEGIGRVRALHTFGKGMGLAAPQINIGRAATVVVLPDPDTEPITVDEYRGTGENWTYS